MKECFHFETTKLNIRYTLYMYLFQSGVIECP